MGHETEQAAIPYEEIFEKKMGFTTVEDATRFVKQSGCDWLSVAVGSVHGAIASNLLDKKKPAAKLDIERIAELEAALNIPLVLHGGSGIENDYILRGIQAGIAKINVGTELRQPYERAMREKNDVEHARECVYTRCRELIRDFLRTSGDAQVLLGLSAGSAAREKNRPHGFVREDDFWILSVGDHDGVPATYSRFHWTYALFS